MKKIFETCVLNVVFAIIAALGVVYQEFVIGIAPVSGTVMLGLIGAIGGSMLGEAINCIATGKKISWKNLGIGTVIGLVAAIVITFTAL